MNELSEKLAQRAGAATPAKPTKLSSNSDLIKVMEPEIKKAPEAIDFRRFWHPREDSNLWPAA